MSAFIKGIILGTIFIFLQAVLIPWIISNDNMPLWVDLSLMSITIIAVVIFMDWIVRILFKIFWPSKVD